MGLNISHGTWSGPYSTFMRWRKNIASIAGFPPLEIMEGFWPSIANEEQFLPITGDWAQDILIRQYFRAGKIPILWDELGDHVGDKRLIPLLRHSDCDGELTPKLCTSIADGLEALLPLMGTFKEVHTTNPTSGRADYAGTKAATLRFITGLRLAASKNELLKFR